SVSFPSIILFFFFSSRRRHTRFSRDWSSDVCSSDLTPWVAKLVAADLIQPLNPDDYPVIEDFYSRWQNFDQVYVDGQMYAIVSRWGYYGIVYNSKYVTAEEARSISVMYDPKIGRAHV